jgi:hypothetical protein
MAIPTHIPACNMPTANLLSLTPDQADRWYREGQCSYSEWQRFQCAWRNASYRWSNVYQAHEGHDACNCPIAIDGEGF